ncbi:MAG: thioredoxin [Deltaproteobacteria bacterium]|nr:thioredoxin [Deltaproteobacteria bacterium]
MAVSLVGEANFEAEVVRSELPVLIDFYADWCQPCRMQSPILEQLSQELEGKVKIVKVNVDQSPRLAAAFQVQAIPMLAVVHRGEVVAIWNRGLADKKTILRLLEPVLPRSTMAIEAKELAVLLREKRAIPVDIRDEASFRRNRIPGAIHIPLDSVEARAAELLPKGGRIKVLYSRTESEAKEIAEKLQKKGVEVGYLVGGLLHWEADGFEVERGEPKN